jgi:hypothetical protein
VGWGGLGGPPPSTATPSSTRGQVLASDPVTIGVEVVGITGFEVFLRFLLGGEISAVVVDGQGGSSREQRSRGGHTEDQHEERTEPADCATLSEH